MAVTIGVSFLLIIPIEPLIWLFALPSGVMIGYYANARSNRRARAVVPDPDERALRGRRHRA